MKVSVVLLAVVALMAIAVMPLGTALAYPQANPSRVLPGSVQRGKTFNVTVNFTAPANNFFLISLYDLAPAGWNVTVNATWCTPVATSVTATGNKTQIIWGGSFNNGTFFTAVYKVAVPEDAAERFYNFTGFLGYYLGGAGPYQENITGDSQVFFPPELEGQVSFSGKGAAPCGTWIEPFVVKGFESGNLSHVLWTTNATTNNTGVFNITGLTPGTYDIGIKNWTCLSEVNTSVTLSAGMTTVVNFGTVIEEDCNHAGTGEDRIGFDDYIDVMVNYGTVYTNGDFNRDGTVDFDDYITVLVNYGQMGDIYIGTHP